MTQRHPRRSMIRRGFFAPGTIRGAILGTGKGGGEYVSGRRQLPFGHLRCGTGGRYSDRRHFSGGMPDVYRGIFADRLRHFLPAALKGGKEDEDHRLEGTGIFAGDPALLILCEGIVEPYLS